LLLNVRSFNSELSASNRSQPIDVKSRTQRLGKFSEFDGQNTLGLITVKLG